MLYNIKQLLQLLIQFTIRLLMYFKQLDILLDLKIKNSIKE